MVTRHPHPVASVRSPCLPGWRNGWRPDMEAAPRVRSGLLRILVQVGRLCAMVSVVGRGDPEEIQRFLATRE